MSKKKDIKSIIFSLIFTILFAIILFTELFNFVKLFGSNDYLNLCLSFLAILVSSVGMYISIIYGVVKFFNKESNSGGKKNGKKKK